MIAAVKEEHPNDIAERLTGRDYISFSAITTYASCPLRYYFRYVEDRPERTVSSSLAFGSRIHACAEYHFNELMAGNSSPDQDTLLSVFWDSWRGQANEVTIRFNKGEDINTVGRLADRVLAAFRESELANADSRILGVEEELRGEIVSGVPDLLARIDLLVEVEDALTVTDLKTSRSRWSVSQTEDAAEQLLLYSELAHQLLPGKPIRVEFAVITKTVKPVVEQLSVTLSPHRIARTKQIVQRIWQAIESGYFYPAPHPANCRYCPFRKPCREWHG